MLIYVHIFTVLIYIFVFLTILLHYLCIIIIQFHYHFSKNIVCSIDVKRNWSLMAWLEYWRQHDIYTNSKLMVPVFPVYSNGQQCYPIVAGYASTIHKVVGQTLHHVTLAFDMPILCPAVGYIALSRVSSLDNVVPLLRLRKSHFINT